MKMHLSNFFLPTFLFILQCTRVGAMGSKSLFPFKSICSSNFQPQDGGVGTRLQRWGPQNIISALIKGMPENQLAILSL